LTEFVKLFFPSFASSVAMYPMSAPFDQFLACLCGVVAGALGYWLAQKSLRRRLCSTVQAGETPVISAVARASTNRWQEPEGLLVQIQEVLVSFETAALPSQSTLATQQGQLAVRQLQEWLAGEKQSTHRTKQDDAAAVLRQREAEDEMVLKWLQDHPASTPAVRSAAPELALSQIASELLPFNPIAVRLIGKTAEPDMTAAVERIEKLLASVDPPATLGKPPVGMLGIPTDVTPTIRDPQGRINLQTDDQQRRCSDQAIIYDTLLRRCLGDDDFAWRMLRKFPSRCQTELELLATELRRRAWVAATRRINQLRGKAANIAAENLRDALANLEVVCRQQSATRADQLLEAVHGEFQQVLDFLARADGNCQLVQHGSDENRTASRWSAALLLDEEFEQSALVTPNLELNTAGSVT
jgi:HPt (histidine-containing phosphotransfer) domain-containing protein